MLIQRRRISIVLARIARPNAEGQVFLTSAFMLMLAASTSCVPVLAPPIRVGLGVALHTAERGAWNAPPNRPQPNEAFVMDLGVVPFALIPDIGRRRWDIAFGYDMNVLALDANRERFSVLHAGYVEALAYPFVIPRGPRKEWRIGVFARSLAGDSRATRPFYGAAFGFDIGASSFARESSFHRTPEEIRRGGFKGYAYGEAGASLRVAADYRRFVGGTQFWSLSLSLSFRLPAAFGIAYSH
ncbi:MAG: hypothetical protein ACI9KE_005912 [Polyangiales bacterium]